MPVSGSLIIYNANIHTLNPAQPHAEALTIINGRIQAIGSADSVNPWMKEGARVIDAQGRTVVPGFIDTHVHFTLTGLSRFAVDLAGVAALDEALRHLSKAAAQLPHDGLVLASGFQPELNPQKRFPTIGEMDQAGDGRPVYIMERGGHISSVNGAALRLLELSEETDGIGRDEKGAFNGVLSSAANMAAFTRFWSVFGQQIGRPNAFDRAARDAVQGGVTTVHALDDLEDVKELLSYQGQLPVRVVPYTQSRDVQAVAALGLRQIGGCGQVALDGDFDPHTAALLEPYNDQPDTCGTLYYTDKALRAYVLEAHQANLQMALHCLGSGAIEQLLNAYEYALERDPRDNHRHRIEHFQLPTPEQIERAKRLGVLLATQPSFNHFWPHTSGYPEVVGPARALQVDPVRRLTDNDLEVAFGSDSPVTPMQPMLWIHSAVNHSNPDERIPVDLALRLCAQTGSRFAFEEHIKGALEPGKLGDCVILDADLLTVPASALKEVAIQATIVGGQVVHEDRA